MMTDNQQWIPKVGDKVRIRVDSVAWQNGIMTAKLQKERAIGEIVSATSQNDLFSVFFEDIGNTISLFADELEPADTAPITYTTHLDSDVHPGDYMYGIVPIPKPPMAAPEGYHWELQPQLHKDDDPYELLWVAVVDTPPAALAPETSAPADMYAKMMSLSEYRAMNAELTSLRARVVELEAERKLYQVAIRLLVLQMPPRC